MWDGWQFKIFLSIQEVAMHVSSWRAQSLTYLRDYIERGPIHLLDGREKTFFFSLRELFTFNLDFLLDYDTSEIVRLACNKYCLIKTRPFFQELDNPTRTELSLEIEVIEAVVSKLPFFSQELSPDNKRAQLAQIKEKDRKSILATTAKMLEQVAFDFSYLDYKQGVRSQAWVFRRLKLAMSLLPPNNKVERVFTWFFEVDSTREDLFSVALNYHKDEIVENLIDRASDELNIALLIANSYSLLKNGALFNRITCKIEKGALLQSPSSLAKMVRAQKFNQLLSLKDKGLDFDCVGSNEPATALMLLAEEGEREGVSFLIENGADCNRRDDNGSCVLYYALRSSNKAIPLLVLQLFNIKMYSIAEQEILLVQACEENHAEVVRYFLDGELNCSLSLTQEELTPLMIAARSGSVSVLEFLLHQDNTIANETDSKGKTALMWAVQNKQLAAVEYLCDHGSVSLEQADCHGRTPLMYAAEGGDIQTARYLLRRGADPLVEINGQSAYTLAKAQGHHEVKNLLASHEVKMREKCIIS